MPSLALTTNVKLSDPRAFALEFSKFSAKVLNKPEQYVSVNVTYSETLTFHGSFDPAFLMVITSLDNLNEEANEGYSGAFFDFFKGKLGVPTDRGYVTFFDPGRAFLGHNGTTFTTIFGK